MLNLAVDQHRQKKVVKRDSTSTPHVRSHLRKFIMTHTKKKRKLAKAKTKAIKVARQHNVLGGKPTNPRKSSSGVERAKSSTEWSQQLSQR